MNRTHVTLERLLRALFAILCVAAAFAPLLTSGFHGNDLALLARASGHASTPGASRPSPLPSVERPDAPRELGAIAPIEVMQILGDDASGDVGSLLSGWSVALSLRTWGTGTVLGGLPAAFGYRLENFVWLVIAALGLWRFLWRIFRPWVGSEQASRASSAAAFLFVLHPLSMPSVAALDGRADAMALAFGTWAAAAFLRGRQEHRKRYVQIAGVLCLLAGLCGQVSLIVPFSLALAEVFSSHRYRRLRERLRTALVTLLVFSAIVQLNAALVSSLTGHGYYPAALVTLLRLGDIDGALRAVALSVEKLGVLLLPANLSTLGLVGLFVAGLLGLVALQPALIAARTAPRLWGWALVCWLAAVAVSLLFGLHERVQLDRLATAGTLLPATAAMCSGLGLAATALPGLRRLGVPIALALGFALLAHGNARPYAIGAATLSELANVVRDRAPDSGVLLFVDAPRDVAGLDPIGGGLVWLRHPLFDPSAPWPMNVRVVDVPGDALGALVRSPLWEPWRTAGLRVGRPDGSGGFAFVDLSRTPLRTEAVSWTGASRSHDLASEPDRVSALRIVAIEEPSADVRVHWRGRASDGHAPLGPWRGPPGRRECMVDLSQYESWLLAGPIERVWFEGGLPVVELVELTPALPPLSTRGEVTRLPGGEWSFGVLDWQSDPPIGTFEMLLLDLDTLETRKFALEPARSGALRCDPPSDLVHRAREYGEHDFVFELTFRDRDAPTHRLGGALPDAFLP